MSREGRTTYMPIVSFRSVVYTWKRWVHLPMEHLQVNQWGKRQPSPSWQPVAWAGVPDHHGLALQRSEPWPRWASPLCDVMQQWIPPLFSMPAPTGGGGPFLSYLEAVKPGWADDVYFHVFRGENDDEIYWAASSDQGLSGIEGLRNPNCRNPCWWHGDTFL